MKDNTRHESGSTRSHRPALSRSATPPWRFQTVSETQTKCIQNRKCDFTNYSASTTYNFNALKCLHFIFILHSALGILHSRGVRQTAANSSGPIRTLSRFRIYNPRRRNHLQDRVVRRSRTYTVHNRIKPYKTEQKMPGPLTIHTNATKVGTSLPRRPLCFSLCSLRPGLPRSENLYKTCTFVVRKGGGAYNFFRAASFAALGGRK